MGTSANSSHIHAVLTVPANCQQLLSKKPQSYQWNETNDLTQMCQNVAINVLVTIRKYFIFND